MSDIDDPQGFSHRFATTNGIRMHYVEEGAGPLVVFLHGYPFLWYLWRHQIRALAAAGYRVVAPDQRGYGQTDAPTGVEAYDITRLIGDVVGLINALGEDSAVVVGQDWGSPVAYNTTVMRPDLIRGVVMMCTPPVMRPPISPIAAMRQAYGHDPDLVFYHGYLGQAEATEEILRDLPRFLLGAFASTAGSASDDMQIKAVWKRPMTIWDAVPVPAGGALPPHLSRQAFDYYVSESERSGIEGPNAWYGALQSGWENTSFLEGAIVEQPALFLTGERDPSMKPMFGFDRFAAAMKALPTTFADLRDVITLPGVGHTPPEEAPEAVNAILLGFLKGIGY